MLIMKKSRTKRQCVHCTTNRRIKVFLQNELCLTSGARSINFS
uniref:Uncharacterized protein n=1 Tax=Anguilla anguilla TaxID=7936 RepID=A0A0E9Q3J4_ANGAN